MNRISDDKTYFISKVDGFGYKIEGENLTKLYPKAIRKANENYLNIYSKIYELTWNGQYSLLWSNSNLNRNDPLSSLNYLLFNIEIIKSLSKKDGDVHFIISKDIDRNYREVLSKICKECNISFAIIRESSLKKDKAKSVIRSLKNKLLHLKRFSKILVHKVFGAKEKLGKKNIYLYLRSKYLSSENKDPFRVYNQIYNNHYIKENSIFITHYTNIKNIKCSDVDEPVICVNNLVGIFHSLWLLIISFFDKIKLRIFKYKHGRTKDFIYNYFISNARSIKLGDIYFMHEIRAGYKKVFQTIQPSLLVNPYSITKEERVPTHLARKWGAEVVAFCTHIITTERLDNRLSKAEIEMTPTVLPNIIGVSDNISFEALKKMYGDKVNLMTYKKESKNESPSCQVYRSYPVLILLQSYNDNPKRLVNDVVEVLNINCNQKIYVKPHPSFPMTSKMEDFFLSLGKQVEVKNCRIEDLIGKVSICISIYSTGGFTLSKYGVPLIWATYLSPHSLCFDDVYKRIGKNANSKKKLNILIQRLLFDREFFEKEKANVIKSTSDIFRYPGDITKSDIIKKQLGI